MEAGERGRASRHGSADPKPKNGPTSSGVPTRLGARFRLEEAGMNRTSQDVWLAHDQARLRQMIMAEAVAALVLLLAILIALTL
jgi:hypothetical protein